MEPGIACFLCSISDTHLIILLKAGSFLEDVLSFTSSLGQRISVAVFYPGAQHYTGLEFAFVPCSHSFFQARLWRAQLILDRENLGHSLRYTQGDT